MKKPFLSLVATLCVLAAQPAFGQTWTAVNNVPNIGATNPLLLTDGTVIVQNGDTSDWYKLTPDIYGNYATGTWSQIASMPSGWGPLYFGSEVMTDGRVIAIGGEYNFGNSVWTRLSGIYDPTTNKWTALSMPSSWTGMGDTATTVLPNGYVYIADPLTNQTAAFDPVSNQLVFPYGGNTLQYNDEAGLTMLPGGNLFRTDCWTSAQAEYFDISTLTWHLLPAMPYNVLDIPDAEMGPAVMQYNGLLMQFGGNGNNIQYNPSTNQWITTPSFPKSGSSQLDVADGGAVVLPNGNVMVAAGPGYYAGAAAFFLWDGTSLNAISGPPDANQTVGGSYNFLLLPNGQVLTVDQSSNIYVYTPSGSPSSSWAPKITTAPTQINLGSPYVITGTQFNGLTQGAAYGDDEQSNTNYPIIKIKNKATGHVFYAKEYSPSTMAICTGTTPVSTHFVLKNAELGPSTIQVVTNGIASAAVNTTILPQLQPSAVSIYPGQGKYVSGNLSSILLPDGIYYKATSQAGTSGQMCSIEADFTVGSGITTISASAIASVQGASNATEQLFIYNFTTQQFVSVGSTPFGSGNTTVSGSITKGASQYIGTNGLVRVIVRGLLPGRVSAAAFTLGLDYVGLSFG